MASDSSDGINYEKLADEIIDRAMASGMTRREIVSAVAGAGAAGAAVVFASDRASAQNTLVIDGIDQIGRDNDRVSTLYVDEINNFSSSQTFDSLIAANSFTDPAGTTHSGELADAGDTASSTSTASGYELTVQGDTYEFLE